MADFSKQVTEWVRQSETRMRFVYREAGQDLIREAQKPRARGGNMPVDTGFLRNSGQAALNSIPAGQSTAPEGYKDTDWDANQASLVLNKAQLGDRIIFGWTANYAPYMEARFGFLRLAAQDWPDIVRLASKRAEKRVKG